MVRLLLAALLLPAPFAQARVSGSIDPQLSRLMTELHGTNLYEMSLAKLAQSKAVSPKVRRYGTVLWRDHSLADAKLLGITGELNVDVEQVGPTEEQSRTLRRLEGLSGPEFDMAFLKELERGHAKTIERLRFAEIEDEPRLRQLVSKLLPILRQHRDLSRSLLDPRTMGVWNG